MAKLQKNHKGFGAVEGLLAIVVIVVIVVGGWVVYKHNHKASSSSSTTTSTSTTKTTTTQSADPYAGWTTYCDSVYKYCFKYPANWAKSTVVTATQPCDAGGIGLKSPDNKVNITYQNDNNKDGGGLISSYTITSSYALNLKGQSLTVVGGYTSSGGNQYPSYALLNTPASDHPFIVGQTTDITALFSDKGTGDYMCNGSLNVSPSTPLSTSDAKTWFNSTDAQTSLLILKSFYNQ